MANRPTVPKFGTWDSDNAGYTVYFEKVRENKGATAPPLHRPFNPNDPEEGPLMSVPTPSSSSSRPATSGGHREPQQQQRRPTGNGHGGHHRRAGSSSSAASDPAGEQSKFAPPPQFQPRPSPQPVAQHYGGDHHQQHRAGQHQHQSPAAHGGGGGHRASQQRQQHYHAAARARSASPQSNASNGRQRPTTVPKFGVWDEQTAASAAQGFTVQFENVKRHREVARTAVPAVPRAPSPPERAAARRAHHHQKTPFVSKMFGCFLPPTTAKD